jgi:hypothetical protein
MAYYATLPTLQHQITSRNPNTRFNIDASQEYGISGNFHLLRFFGHRQHGLGPSANSGFVGVGISATLRDQVFCALARASIDLFAVADLARSELSCDGLVWPAA